MTGRQAAQQPMQPGRSGRRQPYLRDRDRDPAHEYDGMKVNDQGGAEMRPPHRELHHEA